MNSEVTSNTNTVSQAEANSQSSFKNKYSLDKRAKWAAEARQQYPNKFPLIIERAQDKNTLENLEEMANPKFLMPNTFKVAEVLTIIKKKLQLTREVQQQSGIVLFAEGRYLMKSDAPISDIYERHQDKEDGFLYIVYQVEKVYGASEPSFD
ncbi:hypothetical protein FGO68_gene11294 [Halteria grandinella]|uniref:Autophagy-related protein n=1 Tax=Halteria grandinella TaxID=5974 RepID=A0A8J8NM98_HALGN|nr:hypothetical protein FGO68_gene11294 [Halteria grandinella]